MTKRGRQPALSDAQVARVVKLYRDQGRGVEFIAEQFGSNAMTIWRALKRAGVEIRPNPGAAAHRSNARRMSFTPADHAEIVRLYTVEKLSTAAIGKRYGCHNATIQYWLSRLGVARRKQGNRQQGAVWRAKAAQKGSLAQATLAAAAFHQPTLIDLPPHLQERFLAELAKVKAARGTAWTPAGAGNAGR